MASGGAGRSLLLEQWLLLESLAQESRYEALSQGQTNKEEKEGVPEGL